MCEEAIARLRRAFGVDESLAPFYERFRDDPLIGPSVRLRPHLRGARRPEPFEALAWAICEQLIEYERAAAIERKIVVRLGRRAVGVGRKDRRCATCRAPRRSPRPRRRCLQSFDLSAARALALVKAAREVASGRADLHASDHERAWARLRKISGHRLLDDRRARPPRPRPP